MKIILTKDVPGLGTIGDIKDVAPGYARNILLPNRYAQLATEDVIAHFEHEKKKLQQTAQGKIDALKTTAEKLSRIVLEFAEPANERGTLFAGIDTKRIIESLRLNHELVIEPKNIILDHPIKEIGTFPVAFKLSNNLTGEFKVVVSKKN